MTTKKIFLSLILLAAFVTTVSAAGPQRTKVYMFGFATSFNDSTVYLTDIQELDSVWIMNKTKFLVGREQYTAQYKDYLLEANVENPTCVTFFSDKRSKLEKKYVAMRKRYSTGGAYIMKDVTPSQFHYTTMRFDSIEEESKAAKKQRKAAEKEMRKQMKKPNGGGIPPAPRPQ